MKQYLEVIVSKENVYEELGTHKQKAKTLSFFINGEWRRARDCEKVGSRKNITTQKKKYIANDPRELSALRVLSLRTIEMSETPPFLLLSVACYEEITHTHSVSHGRELDIGRKQRRNFFKNISFYFFENKQQNKFFYQMADGRHSRQNY